VVSETKLKIYLWAAVTLTVLNIVLLAFNFYVSGMATTNSKENARILRRVEADVNIRIKRLEELGEKYQRR
jgi:uncharacterized membrane protein YukC